MVTLTILHSEHDQPYSLSYLVAVMKLSLQWGCSSGRDFAMRRLHTMEDSIPPALRLRLARLYNISSWITPAVKRLITTALQKYTDRDIEWLGSKTYVFLARARESYDALRKTIAFVGPDIDDIKDKACKDHANCVKVWTEVWVFKIGKALLHPRPVFALGFWGLEEAIRELDLTGMTRACAEAAVERATTSQVLRAEDVFVDQAVTYLLASVPVEQVTRLNVEYDDNKRRV